MAVETTALLVIRGSQGTFKFAFSFENLSDAYKNEIEPALDQWQTHPKAHQWKKGGFEQMTIDLELYVDHPAGPSGIDSPEKLQEVVQSIVRMAIANDQTKLLEKVTLSVGNFFRRKGYIREARPEWGAPWTSNGVPHYCKLSLVFQFEFDTQPTPGYSYATP